MVCLTCNSNTCTQTNAHYWLTAYFSQVLLSGYITSVLLRQPLLSWSSCLDSWNFTHSMGKCSYWGLMWITNTYTLHWMATCIVSCLELQEINHFLEVLFELAYLKTPCFSNYSRSLILASRNLNIETFKMRESTFEDQVETINLLLSGTVYKFTY